MKMKNIIGTALALTLGMSTVIAFAFNDYYPPERIRCGLQKGRLACNDFNRRYLSEDATNVDFPKGKEMTFHFETAVAYITTQKDAATVFFTYRESSEKMVKLKTIDTSIMPDFAKGAWAKINNELYICTEGYMSCPVTNLPSLT